VLAALVLGCHSAENFQQPPPDLPPPLPVTLSNELRGLKEQSSFPGYELTFKIGYLLRPLFPASDGAAFLSLVDSELDVAGQAGPWETRYSLSVALQRNGTTHRIDAHAQADSEESPLAAGRAAIEQCVLEVYRQTTALLEAES
jgi:hypothetical protein